MTSIRMLIAYFPKNESEYPLFSKEFKKQRLPFQAYRPTDLWVRNFDSAESGVGPQLTLKDLDAPLRLDKTLSEFDIVFQRSIWSWNSEYGLETVDFFFDALDLAAGETTIINTPQATRLAHRKHQSLALLARAHIPVLPFFASPDPIRNMSITRDIPPPAIVKTLEGGAGIGVVYAPALDVLGDVLSLFHRNHQVPLIQPYVASDHDIRVLVIDHEVPGAIRRTGKIHKHNISLGATPTFIPPDRIPSEMREYAVKSAQTLGLHVAGVDFLPTRDGPVVLEVNASPGLQGFSSVSTFNPYAEIAHYIRDTAHS